MIIYSFIDPFHQHLLSTYTVTALGQSWLSGLASTSSGAHNEYGRCIRVHDAHVMCNLTVRSLEGVVEGHESVPRGHAGHRSKAMWEAERVLPKLSEEKEKK